MPFVARLLLACRVIAIAHGDTLTVQCATLAGTENNEVRFAEIDAPEKGQAFGNCSGQHLDDLCFRKQAFVKLQTTDRYGRTVARVECDGVDANAEQGFTGLACMGSRHCSRQKKSCRESHVLH